MSFQPTDPAVRTHDGRNVVAIEPVFYTAEDGAVYRIPVGAKSDGASTPRDIWSFIPPFGTYWLPARFHDAGYQGVLERQMTDGTWALAMLTKDQCDHLFLEMMKDVGVPIEQRDVIYEGVHLAGWVAFRDDRKDAAQAQGDVSL